jgi:nitrite reductase/ring-hydroxylating ferredoxin subunit
MSALEQINLRLAPAAPPETSLLASPRAWYMLCQSRDVPAGRIIGRDFLGHPLVIFRGNSGQVHALDAHCAHMGTHLASGSVVGDCVRCPLHHWTFEGSGQCRGAKSGIGQRAWPVAERYGGIFVFLGEQPLFDPPAFDEASERDVCTRVGRTVSIPCPWIGISSNAFDMRHLDVVHARALREPPSVEQLDPYRFRLRYVSRVTGRGISDRIMKWLSGDRIRVSITSWGGTALTVESDVGTQKSKLLLSMLPTRQPAPDHPGMVSITPLFVRRRTRIAALDALGIRIAAWLFTRFLERDIAMMGNMRFKTPETSMPLEEPLRRYLRFVEQLPKAGREDLCNRH